MADIPAGRGAVGVAAGRRARDAAVAGAAFAGLAAFLLFLLAYVA